MFNWFWAPAKGLKADIERHRKQEAEFLAKIQELEQQEQADPMVVSRLRTYRRFLYQLELSKAETVAKLGKKK